MQTPDFGEDYRKWVADHAADDPDRLRLSFHGDSRPWIPYAITHIAALKRASKKFQASSGESFVPGVIASEIALQQSTSADIALLHASILERHIAPGSLVLDMTCGLGTDTRALSRVFEVTACELNPLHAAMARENFRDNSHVTIVGGDSVAFLGSSGIGRFKAIFIDPARRDSLGRRVYGISDCVPDVVEIWPLLRKTGAVIMCKFSPMLDISQTLTELPELSEVHIIGDGRECKELVTVYDPAVPVQEGRDVPVFLWSSPGRCNMRYTLAEEASAVPLPPAIPAAGDTLWIPGAVAMKGGCFNLISSVCNISPLASNTHLYVSASGESAMFPGHGEKIIDVIPWKSSELKKLKKQKSDASVRVRNFGMTARQLADKLGLREKTDRTMITGVTLADSSRALIVSTRE